MVKPMAYSRLRLTMVTLIREHGVTDLLLAMISAVDEATKKGDPIEVDSATLDCRMDELLAACACQ